MYITVSDLGIPEEVLIRLTDDEGAGSVNTTRAEAAIASAQALVDAALTRLYDLPLADAPELIKKLTSDLTVYNMYLRLGSMPAEVRAAYADSVSVLDKIASGALIPLGVSPAQTSSFTYQDREFSREYMEGF